MVDPQMKEKVRQKLSKTLAEAEECVSEAADVIMVQSTKLASFIVSKRNGSAKPSAPPKPTQ